MKREAKLDHAEFYHRTQIESARAEGERLRRELRWRGVDPTLILIAAGKMAHKAAVRLTVLLLAVFSVAAQDTNHVVLSPTEQQKLRAKRVHVGLPTPPVLGNHWLKGSSFIADAFFTQRVALVVVETVSSNEVEGTIYHKGGTFRTNYALLHDPVILSTTTNAFSITNAPEVRP